MVSFEPLGRIRWYLEAVDFGWPVLADSSRAAYHAYGLGTASTWRVWLSPRTVRFYLAALLRGRIPGLPEADTHQLGGDFIIDPAGVILFAHRSVEPADRPSVESMLAVVRQLAAE